MKNHKIIPFPDTWGRILRCLFVRSLWIISFLCSFLQSEKKTHQKKEFAPIIATWLFVTIAVLLLDLAWHP